MKEEHCRHRVAQSSALLMSLLCDLLPGGSTKMVLEVGIMCWNTCCTFGTLLCCHKTHSGAVVTSSLSAWHLRSPVHHKPHCHASRGYLQKPLCGIPSHRPHSLLPQLADLQMSNATTQRLIRSLRGILLHTSA